MQEELRKIAKTLRDKAADRDKQIMIKCAEIIRGVVGLTLLKRKLGVK
ncbi:MAG: hypothetical protein PVI90_00265 [Desulfobacteraceae bacterium]|jgi:hypothetical protein